MQTKAEKAAWQSQYNRDNPERTSAARKKWRLKNLQKSLSSGRAKSIKSTETLSDCYLSWCFSSLQGIPQTAQQIRQLPDVIKTYRLIMKIRRQCRIKIKENAES
tara:strand:+ start:40 stop:354 length:315 start_codon:yes stop_codon:yes gene_type:complete